MRLTKKYYTLRYDEYELITKYLTKIKALEKRIRNINITLDNDKQTLLYLDITLSENL